MTCLCEYCMIGQNFYQLENCKQKKTKKMFKFASTIGQRGSKAFLKSVSNNNVFSKNSCKFLKELTQQSVSDSFPNFFL